MVGAYWIAGEFSPRRPKTTLPHPCGPGMAAHPPHGLRCLRLWGSPTHGTLATDVHLFSSQFLDADRLARFHRPWQSTDPGLPPLLQELRAATILPIPTAWLAPRDWTIPTFLLAELQSSAFCPFLIDANDDTGRRVYCFDGYGNEKLVVFSAFRPEFMHPRDLMGLVRSQRSQEWYAPGCAPIMVLSHTHVVLITDVAPGLALRQCGRANSGVG